MKPKFDPSRVANLLKIGTAEARGDARPLNSMPTAPEPASAEVEDRTVSALGETGRSTAADASPAEEDHVAPIEKRAITVRLSDEVLSALYRHQAEMRCLPGARLRDTTIGGVIDTLLRGSLKLPTTAR